MALRALVMVLAALVASAPAYAGPYDVSRTRDPHSEPVGNLKPEHILAPEAQEPDPVAPAPRPPVEDVAIQSESGIDVQDTSADDPVERIGTLPAAKGLGETVWQYMAQGQAAELLSALPTPMPAGSLRDAVIALLSSEATPPRDHTGGWLYQRIEALLRIGAVNEAAALQERVPGSALKDDMLTSHALSMVLAGRTGQACSPLIDVDKADVESLPVHLQRFYWFCIAHDGRFEEVELAFSLKRESGEKVTAWFASLIEAMQYPKSRLTDMPEKPHPLDMAMILSTVPAQLPKSFRLDEMLTDAYQPYHELLWQVEKLPAALRAEFAESVVESGGGVGRSEIEALYRAAMVPGKAAVPSDLSQRIRAYLKLVDATSTKTALRDFNDALKAFGHRHTLARLMLTPPLSVISQTMRPEQPYLSYAPQAFAMLLASGKLDDTGKWLRMMDLHREDAASTYVAHELVRFVALKDKRLSRVARQLPPYAIPDQADRDDLRLLQRYFRIMPLFGYQTPEITTAMLDETLSRMESNQMAWPIDVMKQDAEAGNMAGVLLRSASFLKRTHWLEVNDDGLHLLLESLLASGQKDLARRIAMFSLIAFMQ